MGAALVVVGGVEGCTVRGGDGRGGGCRARHRRRRGGRGGDGSHRRRRTRSWERHHRRRGDRCRVRHCRRKHDRRARSRSGGGLSRARHRRGDGRHMRRARSRRRKHGRSRRGEWMRRASRSRLCGGVRRDRRNHRRGYGRHHGRRVLGAVVWFPRLSVFKPWLHPPFALHECPIESKTERFERPTKTTLRILQPLLAFLSILRFDWTISCLGIVVLQLCPDFTTLSYHFTL